MPRLTDKRVLVTGAGRGIGTAIARRLAAEGASVVLSYNRSAAQAQALAAEICASGGRAHTVMANAAEAGSARRLIQAAVDHMGGLDVLVNNAALIHVAPLQTLNEEQIQEMLDVNLRSVILACRAALDHLPPNGRIITIGSSLAERSFSTGVATYAGTKAGLAGFTRALAREVGPRGINVNMVHPGNTETDMNPVGTPRSDCLRTWPAPWRFSPARMRGKSPERP